MVGEKWVDGAFVAAHVPSWRCHLPPLQALGAQGFAHSPKPGKGAGLDSAGIAEVSGRGETSLEGSWHWVGIKQVDAGIVDRW